MQQRFEVAYLHIGMPKAGSTAIQRTCKNGYRALADDGILYPLLDAGPVAWLRLVFSEKLARSYEESASPRSGFEQHLRNGFELRKARAPAIMEQLVERLESAHHEKLLLSSELFSGLDRAAVQRVYNLLQEHAKQSFLVFYVRHPVSFAVSWSQQKIKRGLWSLESISRKSFKHVISSGLQHWLDVFDLDHAWIIPYDRRTLINGAAEYDLLSRIGFTGDVSKISAQEVNVTMSMAATIVKSRMNSYAIGQGAQLLPRKYLFEIKGPKFSFPSDELDRLRTATAEDVRWLEETCGVVLPEPEIPPYYEPAECFTSEVVECVARIGAQRSNFKSKVEADAYVQAVESLRMDGIMPPLARRSFSPAGRGQRELGAQRRSLS